MLNHCDWVFGHPLFVKQFNMETTAIEKRPTTLDFLYNNYGKTSDEEIADLLSRIAPVIETHKGPGTVFGLYEISAEQMEEVKASPRSLSFASTSHLGKLRDDLNPFLRISVLVKSPSLFALLPDIGEVFDQMTDEEKTKARAVKIDMDNITLIQGTDGQHFVLDCTLYS